MTVTYQVLNLSQGGGSDNLLINPRGKINQASDADGVLSPGQYFCDGWKAGDAGAEVYRDPDGFRLITGTIVQLVPNNIGVGRTLRGNMDTISGAPQININGGGDNVASNDDAYIKFEVSGNNSKFNRLILADSTDLPIYRQNPDELSPCQRFLYVSNAIHVATLTGDVAGYAFSGAVFYPSELIANPAMSVEKGHDFPLQLIASSEKGFSYRIETSTPIRITPNDCYVYITADARP